MRLINVATVWAQFPKKKIKHKAIPHMTPRQLVGPSDAENELPAHKVNVSKWGVQHAHAWRTESEAE